MAYGLKSIKYKAVSLWNDLPQSIKDIESINKFKQSTKLHLFKQL